MKSIYIGVCKTREDARFKKSLHEFLSVISEYYSAAIEVITDKFLPDAQNILAKHCIEGRYDYLLLLDDDHWGHTKEMLDCLIKADTHMATMKTYSRHYPYGSALLQSLGHGNYASIDHRNGYHQIDICGFPMTLIRRDVFDILDEPYFRAVDDGARDWSTDVNFCQRLSERGIKPIGCFDHCLPHDKITEANVVEYRNKERFEQDNIVLYKLAQENRSAKLAFQ